jgi:hypothetical protein
MQASRFEKWTTSLKITAKINSRRAKSRRDLRVGPEPEMQLMKAIDTQEAI